MEVRAPRVLTLSFEEKTENGREPKDDSASDGVVDASTRMKIATTQLAIFIVR
jgi:hypothetical protein